MKRLNDLTKKEKAEWLKANAVRKLGTVQDDLSAVKYIVENNSREEVAEWLNNATTTYFDASCAPYFCTVLQFNALHEYLDTPAKYVVRMAQMSQRKLAERFDIPLRTVEDWCAGRRQPPEYVLKMMCEILGIAY